MTYATAVSDTISSQAVGTMAFNPTASGTASSMKLAASYVVLLVEVVGFMLLAVVLDMCFVNG